MTLRKDDGGYMKRKQFNLLDVDLSLFDGEGGAPAGGADGGVATATSKEAPESPQKVIYGKVDGESGEVDKTKSTDKPDLSAEFESKIKGEYKEHFDKRVQDIINKRFKDVKALESKVTEVDPVLKLLQRKYGTDSVKDLMAKIETEYVEEMAYAEGLSPDQYRKIMHADEIAARDAEYKQQQEREMRVQAQVQKWHSEAEAMKAEYPDFNLSDHAQNDQFMDLLKSGVPVKAAYELLNLDNIKAQIQATAQSQVTQNIQAKQSRPKEAAARGQQGAIIKSDVSKLTAQDRAEIAKRAARGEKISF